MLRVSIRRAAVASLAATTLVVMTMLAPAHATGRGPTDRLPDLRMIKPQDVRVIRYHGGQLSGHRLLRFTTIITNEGRGPLELRGKRTAYRSGRVPRCPCGSASSGVTAPGEASPLPPRCATRWATDITTGTPSGLRVTSCGSWVSPTRRRCGPRSTGSASSTGVDGSGLADQGPVSRIGATVGYRLRRPDQPQHPGRPLPWVGGHLSLELRSASTSTSRACPRGEYLLCVTADPSKRFRQTRHEQRRGLGAAADRRAPD